MIVKVKLVQILGKFKSFIRGPGILLRGECNEEEEISVVIYRRDFPAGLVSDFLIGEEVCCSFRQVGHRTGAEVLPLENQDGVVVRKLVTMLIKLAEQAGTAQLEELPEVNAKQLNGPLPPRPHPKAAELERMFRMPVDDPPSEEEDHPS